MELNPESRNGMGEFEGFKNSRDGCFEDVSRDAG
jgi:hypothetical protein